MVDKPILRFPNPVLSTRRTGAARNTPSPRGPGRGTQGQRFQGTFDRLSGALNSTSPEVILRADPAGIAPERALVFVTAGSIQNFVKAATAIGLEVFAESELEDETDFPEGFVPANEAEAISRMLYATMPTLDVFRQIISLWNLYQRGGQAPNGAAPWWAVFELLLEIRPWGPEDRLTEGARVVIEDRLPPDLNEEVSIEIEIWPTLVSERRVSWRRQAEQAIISLGGRVIDRSSITERGFVYEAILARLPAYAVRNMLDNPNQIGGLATLEGVQFILPQTIGQGLPRHDDGTEGGVYNPDDDFNADAPIRAALLDGTPVAAHPSLNGGVVIADIHDIVQLSTVNQRHHATAMASLILRGDLEGDGVPLRDARLISVPLLIDSDNGPWSPANRLFVDLVHSTLVRLIGGEAPIAPSVFVVNFSIGVANMRFAGRISALARLMDWWALKEGILFVISAGNITDSLFLDGVTSTAFEIASLEQQSQFVRAAMRAATYNRTLLAPSEALNGVTVGAVSSDLNGREPPHQAGIFRLHGNTMPQLTSALGPGLHRLIKPDFIGVGGCLEVRPLPNGHASVLRPLDRSQRTGLVVAAPDVASRRTQRSKGTSAAAAMTTRSILQSAQALTGTEGAYQGQELPRRVIALITRALAINAARWTDDARSLYEGELTHFGTRQHVRAKEEVCRYFGYGVLHPELMQYSPENGVTMVGYGTIRKDQALIFRMPLPISMAGDRIPRSMRATIAWFSPINPARAQYRLAGLEAVIAGAPDEDEDGGWGLNLKADGPTANMIKRGSVWSKRMVHRTQTVPDFDEGNDIPICVQCRDASGGGLSQDEDILFALAVTLEIEADVQYDIYDEVQQQIRLRLRGNA